MSQDMMFSLSSLTPRDHPTHPYSSWPAIPVSPIGRGVLVTPEVTVAAARESLKTGKRFALDHSVYPSGALVNARRQAGTHTFIRCDPGPKTREQARSEGRAWEPAFDDAVAFNTQSSTQWDYFLHCSYYGSGLFYGGITAEQIEAEDTGGIGVAALSRAGGLQTRGVLLDVPHYLESNGLPLLDALSYPANVDVNLDLLKAVLSFERVTVRPGDVLLVRLGFESEMKADSERVARGEKTRVGTRTAGLKAGWDTMEWIWENGVVAIATDNGGFEDYYEHGGSLRLHPPLLSGMGVLIGELFALDALAEECKRENRWHFYFSSQPIMVEGGVASPPNAVAIF